MDNAIHIADVTIIFDHLPLFERFCLRVPAGEHWAILGRSGIGKSTLIHAIAGLFTPASGRISNAAGQPLSDKVAWLAQKDSLLPWLSVRDNVALSARLRRPLLRKLSAKNIEKARDLLDKVGLSDYEHVYPDTLSGGQRQRVALARTLFCERPIVLMDEPFSALDAVTKLQLQDLTAHLLRDKTVLLITHDPLEALRLADVVTVMRDRPATLSAPIHLDTPAPRDVENADILAMQGQLLHALRQEIEQQPKRMAAAL